MVSSIVLCLLCLHIWLSHCGHPKRISSCRESFLKDIAVLSIKPDSLKSISSRSSFLSDNVISEIDSTKKLVVDATFGAAHSLFHHMTQLNVSGIEQSGNYTENCRVFRSSTPDSVFRSHMLYINPGQLEWLHILEKHPHTIVLNNDLPDKEWYDYRHPSLKAKPDNVLANDIHLYGDLPFSDVVLLRKAYRALITCAVPKEQLLSVDFSVISSVDFWTRLTNFLGVTVSVPVMTQLIEGGVSAPLKRNEECSYGDCRKTSRSSVKPFWDVAPSVCDDRSEWLPDSERQRLNECAVEYSTAVGGLLGSPSFGSLLLSRMREAPTAVRRADRDTRRLIVNAGPGTTGTRTLHLVFSQLNITARHFMTDTRNCTFIGKQVHHEIDSDMRVLLHDASEVGETIYWGDTPAPERWWHLLKMYPHTRVIMTDIRNDSAWLTKRLAEHCGGNNSRRDEAWSPCTVPLPVDFDRWSPLSLRLYRAAHLSAVNESTAAAAFDAYRRLVRCAVPEKQLMWMYVSEQNDSSIFWNRFFDFVNVSLSAKVKDTLIAAGLPRWSTKGCTIGNIKCRMGRHGKSAVDPSVCTIPL